jgi:iron(III) transport system ATP-binding protein
MTPIVIRQLVKTFGTTRAVDGIDLDIPEGDLFFLLGPSGCGKTTLLRMIAGFSDPTYGLIRFGDDDVTHLPPNQRDTGMVFQGYALWPHMTVRQNVAFGLEVRKLPRNEVNTRVDEALASVQLTQQAERKTNQLSGGQQQRVALARALVIRPRVLLLDEPLSNLDAKLRVSMRQSIRDICKQSGITGIYVTHDQKEALSMADGIAVLSKGQLMQAGPPRKLYERPANRFVADFLGETNFLSATVQGREGDFLMLQTPVGLLRSSVFDGLAYASGAGAGAGAGGVVTLSVRPEALRLHRGHRDGQVNALDVSRASVTYLGEVAQYQLRAGKDSATSLTAYELNPKLLDTPDEQLYATIDPSDVVVLAD